MAQEALDPGAPVEVDNRDPAAGAQIFPQICPIGDTVVDMVVRVAGEYEIDSGGRQHRISRLGENGFDVRFRVFVRSPFNQFGHFRIDIDSENFSNWSDRVGEPEGEVTAPGAKIGSWLHNIVPMVGISWTK